MISLIYKIMGDINPFKQAVTKDAPAAAAKGGSEAGKAMGAQFKGAVLRYLGAGAILGALTAAAAKAAEILRESQKIGLSPEAYQELQKAMEQTGLSMEELLEKAREVPKEFEALMESIRASGGIMSDEDVQQLAEVNKTLDEAKNAAAVLFSWLWKAGKVGLLSIYYGLKQIGAAVMGVYGIIRNDKDVIEQARQAQAEVEVFKGDLADMFSGEPAAPAGKRPKTPAQKFREAAEAKTQGRKNLAKDMTGVADLITMGLGISEDTAKSAGLVPKSRNSAKTIDDLVAAIVDVKNTIREVN